MHAWNFTSNYIAIPTIGYLQGLMLWAIIAITGFIINDRKKYLVAFSPKSQLSEDEIDKIMERVRLQRNAELLNSMILKDIKDKEKTEKSDDKENV